MNDALHTNGRTILDAGVDHYCPETYPLIGMEVTSVSLSNPSIAPHVISRR